MGLEDRFAEHDKVIVDKYHDPNGWYLMNTRDYVLRPSADGQTGPTGIWLPPVAEAKGRFYSIICRDADAINTITIRDRADSECWLKDIVMNGKCDRILMYSDGLAWHALGGGQVGKWPGLLTTAPPGTTEPTTLATTLAPTSVVQ